MNVLAAPSPGSVYVPALLYAQFEAQFAAVTVGILLGAVTERGRVFPTIVFTFIWTTLVYCPMVPSLPSTTDFRHAGSGIQQDGQINGAFLISLVAGQLKLPAAWERSLIPLFLGLAMASVQQALSNRTVRIVFPMLFSAQLCSGSAGLGLIAGVRLEPIFAL